MLTNTIIHGDNLDYLNELSKEKCLFDLIVTDPPYNIGKDFGNNTDKQTLDNFISGMDDRFKLLDTIMKDDASILIFCTHRYVGHLQYCMYKYFEYRRLMIWHYKNGLSRQNKEPVTEYDPFLWFSKSNQFTYNAELVRVPYKTERVNNPIYKKNKAGIKIAWNPNPNGAKRGDIWEYPTLSGKNYENERTDHPTQKPEALILDLIKAFCPLNKDGRLDGFVLDPYMGSGTTAVCCERLNRQGNNIKWLGIELEQKWIDIANKRIDKEKEKLYERDIFI